MPVISLAVRRQAKAEELLVEAQCRALDLGHPDVAGLIRSACVLLTTPPPVAPANVVAFRRREAA